MAGTRLLPASAPVIFRKLRREKLMTSYSLILKEFAEQFTHSLFARIQRSSPARGSRIHPPDLTANPVLFRAEQALLLQGMHNRVKRARAQSVSVSAKFLDHSQAENRLVACVMKYVQSDQP